MAENLVGYSRAGDAFHYRWAARRCLAMVYPNAELQYLVVEGSSDNDLLGEYSIDVSEYYLRGDRQITEYYQLKHSTVQNDIPFQLSDLQTTFEGFSSRFIEHYQRDKESVKAFGLLFLRIEALTRFLRKILPNRALVFP